MTSESWRPIDSEFMELRNCNARRSLQIAVAILALVPIGAGHAGVLLGPAVVAATQSVPLDSHSA
jgi:hypothetical protein